MSAGIIDGKQVAAEIRQRVKSETARLRERSGGGIPGLAVVLVGDDPASAVYVRNKNKACVEMGFRSFEHHLPASTPEGGLLELVHELNADSAVNGILIQLPLPGGIDSRKILNAVSPEKDVDGFHPVNVGRLASGEEALVPCTPAGVMELLDHYKVPLEGRQAVVLGRSNIVGKPAAALLLQRNATVTICHSRTRDLASVTRGADILVAAIGKPRFVTENMVKPGAVVIDVGINRVEGKLVGDVDFEPVAKLASLITPVPGGVGPMTIAMLMSNTLKAFKQAHRLA